MKRMTIEQYKAHLQGKVNRAQGESFEGVIEASCLQYKIEGDAFIEKTPEPMKVIQAIDRSRGIFKAIFQKPAQPDYKGTLAGGRAVCFEAKMTSTDRIKQDAVTREQWDALDEHEAMGALCFVLVMLGHRAYRVPWECWKTMRDLFGHKYMNEKDLEPYQVQYKNGAIRFLDLTIKIREFLDKEFEQQEECNHADCGRHED